MGSFEELKTCRQAIVQLKGIYGVQLHWWCGEDWPKMG